MTMPFEVADPRELRGVEPGAVIEFTLVVEPRVALATGVRVREYPVTLDKLLEKGNFGQKTKAGFFKKEGKAILRLDPATGTYVESGAKADPIVDRILKKPAAERLKLLRESSNPQAQFLWAILRDSFHYVAVHLAEIAESAREVDFAMRWGFGMKQGPFELWQEAGWQQVATWRARNATRGGR
mgnify:CR=1 FL=1